MELIRCADEDGRLRSRICKHSYQGLSPRGKTPVRATLKNYLPSIMCVLTVVFCYLVVRPYAEIGVDDEWAYIKSAQVLAQTGHIAYNGWVNPMLGWQLYFGALFIKIFGFSFTAVRLSTVVEAVATAFLFERSCLRCGVSTWNARLLTAALFFSPAYFPIVFSFMTDVSGLFCIVACLYMCLRAVQAANERSATAWIVLAALSNAVGGTARQIAWLGVLVMVPSALWLLRKSQRVLTIGGLSCVAGAAFVAAAMRWFAHQPYTVPEALIPAEFDWEDAKVLVGVSLYGALVLGQLLLPLLLLFMGSFRSWRRHAAVGFGIGLLCLVAVGLVLLHAKTFDLAHVPYFSEYMTITAFGRLNALMVQITGMPAASDSLNWLLTGAVVLGMLSFFAVFLNGAHGQPADSTEAEAMSWRRLGIVLGPFTLAYMVFLMPRAIEGRLFERYLLPLVAVFLLVLARYYQEHVRTKLPLACILLIALFGCFGAAATHDKFALYRGYAAAIHEIKSSGVPATAILGPWEFLGWTEVEVRGYVNDPRIEIPRGIYINPPPRVYPQPCDPHLFFFTDRAIDVHPDYAVFLDPKACGGQVAFPPVVFNNWIAPHTNWVYPVRLPPPLSQ